LSEKWVKKRVAKILVLSNESPVVARFTQRRSSQYITMRPIYQIYSLTGV